MNFVSTPGTSTCRRYIPGRCRSSIHRTVPRISSHMDSSRSAFMGWHVTHETSRGQLARAESASSVNRRTSPRTPSSAHIWSYASIQARHGIILDPTWRPPTFLYSIRSGPRPARCHSPAHSCTSPSRSLISPGAGPRSGTPSGSQSWPLANPLSSEPDCHFRPSAARTSAGRVQLDGISGPGGGDGDVRDRGRRSPSPAGWWRARGAAPGIPRS